MGWGGGGLGDVGERVDLSLGGSMVVLIKLYR